MVRVILTGPGVRINPPAPYRAFPGQQAFFGLTAGIMFGCNVCLFLAGVFAAMIHTRRLIQVVLVSSIALAAPAGAQTRTEELAKKQAEKAAVVKPPEPNRAERIIARLQNSAVLGGVPSGFFPVVASIYPGSWLAFGAGYRANFADTGHAVMSGAYSVRNFKAADFLLHLPEMADRRVLIDLDAKWLDAPSVAFYGVGPDSVRDDKTVFAYQPTTVGVTARVRPVKFFTLGAGVQYLDINTGAGDNKRYPSIETIFSPADAPGLGVDPTYLRTRAFAEVDWRRPPGYTGSGGLYRVELQNYDDRDDLGVAFRSFEGEVIQLFPILRANWVIAVRGLVTITDHDSGDVVPYFMMPSLGGSRFNRGFTSFRFRGITASSPASSIDGRRRGSWTWRFSMMRGRSSTTERPRFRRSQARVRHRRPFSRTSRNDHAMGVRAQQRARDPVHVDCGSSVLIMTKQMKNSIALTCALLASVAVSISGPRAAAPKFYPDDPLWVETDTQDAAGVEEYEIGLAYDTLENLFSVRATRR